eukprot:TRINITY_DN51486_c0_g1_i1.p1 TRINITY_DN51486_c0_g1~~TRINITY_DN51486_c0_g1_i1.p1  ORF type:complete len:260 (+),score=15.17 TRINITY_DN51486_c0_g1_i1:175-954(+)
MPYPLTQINKPKILKIIIIKFYFLTPFIQDVCKLYIYTKYRDIFILYINIQYVFKQQKEVYMDFKYIEQLVINCKNNDKSSKEKLAEEFRPFIYNISKKTFIDGYDIFDIQNECYHTLFKCVYSYNIKKHRFVGYATNAIRNNINDLIRRFKNRKSTEGIAALAFSDDFEKNLPSQDINLEDLICDKCDYIELRLAINKLNEEEKELIDFIFFKNNTIRNYAYLKNICYSTANFRKKNVLKKIYKFILLQQFLGLINPF